MSEKAQHDQAITRYLLGNLPEPEAERLDELSFTDEEFARALNAAENELVDAYVRGELAGADLERFRAHYLASPLRRQKVSFAEALRDFAGARAPAAEVTAGEPVGAEAKEGSGWLNALKSLAGGRPALRWGAALAALALLAAAGWLAFEGTRPRREAPPSLAERPPEPQNEPPGEGAARATPEQERPERAQSEEPGGGLNAERPREVERVPPPRRVSVASFVLAPQVRGAGSVAEITVPAGATHVAMRLELESDEHRAYRVALLDPSNGQSLWSSGKLRPAAGGASVGVRLRAGLLKPRVYMLRVTGLPAGGAPEIVGDYPFRVVK